MGNLIYPPQSGSPIKSIQRGNATSSGSITISAINTSKSFVRSFSNGSAGTAAISGSTSGTLSPSGGNVATSSSGNSARNIGSHPSYSGTRSLSGGTTNITSAEYGVYITNSTTLTATGACYWEVVEYN